MSADALPISPSAFASAIRDLPLSTLHLKNLELRNSIAHLDYSNEELTPFATGDDPDPVCIDAIAENETVIKRMEERIALLKEEVERRGISWREFMDVSRGGGEPNAGAEDGAEAEAGTATVDGEQDGVNGTAQIPPAASGQSSSPWTDGTFQTGRIVNGEVIMNGVGSNIETSSEQVQSQSQSIQDLQRTAATQEGGGRGAEASQRQSQSQGGSLTDEELRRRLAALGDLGDDEDEDEGGLHL